MIKFQLSLNDKFYIIPYIWKQKEPHEMEAAKYYGHTWSFVIYWLWFELTVYESA